MQSRESEKSICAGPWRVGRGGTFPVGNGRKSTQAETSMPESSEEERVCCVGNGEALHAWAMAGEETERWVSPPCGGSHVLYWGAKRFVLPLCPFFRRSGQNRESYGSLPVVTSCDLLRVNCLRFSCLSFPIKIAHSVYLKDKYAMKHWKCSPFGFLFLDGKTSNWAKVAEEGNCLIYIFYPYCDSTCLSQT